MCHYLFALPVVGLVSFALLPFPQAAAVYSVVLLVSSAGFILMLRSQRKPVAAGLDGLVGGTGQVIAVQDHRRHGDYLVRYKGESWFAVSEAKLEPGAKVKVKSLAGNRLVVEPLSKA